MKSCTSNFFLRISRHVWDCFVSWLQHQWLMFSSRNSPRQGIFWVLYAMFLTQVLISPVLSHKLWCVQVGQLKEASNKAHNAELKLFLEVHFSPQVLPPLLHIFQCMHTALSWPSLQEILLLEVSPLVGLACSLLLQSDVLYLLSLVFQERIPIPPPDKTKEDVLLFFKLYNPEKEELR